MFGGIPAFGGHSLDGSIERAATLTAKDSRLDIESETFFVVPPIDASYGRLHGCSHQDANHGHSHLIVAAFAENSRAELRYEAGNGSITGALSGGGGKVGQGMSVAQVGTAVRRLTPRECERLQGMPNDYTLIPWRGKPAEECPDGPRYKAIGNSKAVTVVRWIGRRILQQLTD
jgi:DNA (cytosine-5)-methyltransferase 1